MEVNMKLRYEKKIPVEDYLRLRESVHWAKMAYKQAVSAVENCFCSICCYDGDKVIGMLRILWTGDYCAYLTDVVVDEAYRGQGIATCMMNMAIQSLRDAMEEDYNVKLFLMAAKGRESFYEPFGFVSRPNDTMGAAMDMWLKK